MTDQAKHYSLRPHEGKALFVLGEISAPAGATVHVPGNVPHGFRNVGTTMGKVLAMYEPAPTCLISSTRLVCR